jgi:hypothetical protein
MDQVINFEEQYYILLEEQKIFFNTKDELEDWKDDFKNIMNEECLENDDRKHCSCVPSLRKAIKKLIKERDDYKLKGEILCSQLGTIMVEFHRFKKVFNEA